METNPEDLRQFTVKGDGGTIVCAPARLTWLKDEFRHITTHAGWSVNDRRWLAEDTRYCRWPGQSPDGRKHSDANAGKPAFPFEGASDVRMRTADEIINEQIILIMAAVMRMQLKFTSPDPAKAKLGDQMAVLWEWMKNNQLRREWFVELRKLAQFRQGDSPAVGFLQVYWHEDTAMINLTVSAEEALEQILKDSADQGDQVTSEIEANLKQVFSDRAHADLLAQIIGAHWPDLSPARAKAAAADMQKNGEATFPYPVAKPGRVALRARRLMKDIFVPENTEETERARVIYIAEWFTAPELRDKERKGDFQPGFVDEVLKHEGETAWRHWTYWNVNGDYSNRIVERSWDKERHRGQYQILTAYFKGSNKDGIVGIYSVGYHHAVEIPGTKMELFDCEHGKYPFPVFTREILTGRLWDTRGIAELSMTEQQALKTLHDSFIDHAQLSTVPPVKVPASRPKLALVIGPLKLIKEQRPNEISFMAPPAYPASNDKANERIEKRLNRFFGRMSPDNAPDWIRAYQQDLIDFFLLDLVEAIKIALQLNQQYMDDETLLRVLGPDGLPIAKSVKDIQGQFDIEITFDAGMLSMDFIKIMADLVSNYALKWDSKGLIRRDELEQWFLGSLSPSLARRLLRPVKDADQSEVEAAQVDFGKIKDGIEPDRPTDGVDFQTRLDTILGIGQMNPEAFQTLAPNSRKILEDHVQYLQGQIMQQQNAVVGREMAKRTLPIQGAPAAA
jgi:hypothetical protein